MSLTATDPLESLEDYEDLTSWINDVLTPSSNEDSTQGSVENLSHLDQQIVHLIASLDIACEDTSTLLERIIDDVSRGVPRLTYDLHFIKDGTLSLQTALNFVRENSRDTIPKATNDALEELKRLDTIKGHMEAAREVLREAESWSTLEMEVASLLTVQNYAKAASRLSEANRSMVVFQNTPEYDPRRNLLINLQNQLEASLSSALVAAINEQDLNTCRNYFSIFSNIQREQEFRNYYNGSRKASLVTLWKEASLVDCDTPDVSSAQRQTFSEFLTKFYTAMLSLLNQERNSIPAIFPDPELSLSSLISSTFASLHPTFPQRLGSLFTHYGDSAFIELIKIFHQTEEFAGSVDKTMQKMTFTAASPASEGVHDTSQQTPVGPSHPGHSRRRSMRMSVSLRSGSNRSSSGMIPKISKTADALEWEQELFQPFLEFQVDYGTLERRFLDDSLRGIISSDASDRSSTHDQARMIKERAIDIFSAAEQSLTRYTAFTHGYGALGLVQALDGFLKSFVDMWTADVSYSSTSERSMHTSGDLSGLDYTAEDWMKFQTTLHLLGSARNIFERMMSFEVRLRSELSQTAVKFKLYHGDPTSFPMTPCKGVGQLLDQSTLNSVELHALLERFDSDVRHIGEPLLLTEARSAVFEFARACQISLETTIGSPLRKSLDSYASSSWMIQSDAKPKTSNELKVPTFSLSPSDVILRVTEGLLNLPQVFELHGDDDALAFSLHTLPNVDPEILKSIPEQSTTIPEVVPQTTHPRRQSFIAPNIKPLPIDPETVSSAWLSSIGQSLLAHLTSDVLPQIKRLTTTGTAQLSSDLSYLSNVARSLNLEHGQLEKWKEYVEMDDVTGLSKISSMGTSDSDYVLEQVARMRGWH
ncbi:hypothetical protein E1B28_000677 [Marasmius oreades]|uniref:Conserved oligomeric Golgi complex subunit 7 n=1 Tax=Marasmius oreades TaxID=181124 RepID=A0A9P7V1V4_9AGAR|nr:uncharacterized protein E1B28_000677 [Marasmius oreades]KAG7098769.1 hypothetical protein E1B28_000677 [Marasmius oreades]